VISRDGRSRAFINSSPVQIQLLKTLGEYLIDIHGQHAHQSLMNRHAQRALLDSYAAHSDLLESVRSAWQSWNTATRQLAETRSTAGDHESTISLLQYQVQELEDLSPQQDEYEQLEQEHKRLANVSRLQLTTSNILTSLNENEASVDATLHNAIRELKDLIRFEPGLNGAIELLDNASIQLTEAITELKSCCTRFESDPEQLDRVEKRLDRLHDTARKHHVPVQNLATHLLQLQGQLDRLVNSREAVSTLLQEQAKALTNYQQSAQKLSKSRVKAAKRMAEEVSSRLRGLGMPEAHFIAQLTQGESDTPQAGGIDQIEFLVSMNPGQAPQPMRKVASGGELSRISLAIQIISKDEHGIPTLIFDEVDAGIGGGTAEIVGKLLNELAQHHQLFCVTHLAQVASQAHHHFQVSKQALAGNTLVVVRPLVGEERVDEIARMIGGVRISEKTRAHAKEMLADLAKARKA
jgi:DNA repair protein RecN (Recombination protein N)